MSETTISLQVSSKDNLKKKCQKSLRDTGDAEKGAESLSGVFQVVSPVKRNAEEKGKYFPFNQSIIKT